MAVDHAGLPLTPDASRQGSGASRERQRRHMPRLLVSLGNVLIDCFEDARDRSVVKEVLGGGGLYAIIGARIWLASRKLAVGIDRGPDDFPGSFSKVLEHFGPMWYFHIGPDRQTLKARIGYSGDERSFEYLSPPPHRTLKETVLTPLERPHYLHLVASPEHTLELVEQARSLGWEHTKFVLEPHPKHCTASDLEGLKGILKHLHVLSPNHDELRTLFSVPTVEQQEEVQTRQSIESLLQALLDIGVGRDGQGIVVVRSGSLGACVGTRAYGMRWVPAFHGRENHQKVVDVTGAGNAFLGGFIAGLATENDDPFAAALYGSVSASFVVEQLGVPCLSDTLLPVQVSSIPTPPVSEDGDSHDELWNGVRPSDRLDILRNRISAA